MKPEKLLSFWHYGIYREQGKENEWPFMEFLQCASTVLDFLNAILLIIREIFGITNILKMRKLRLTKNT